MATININGNGIGTALTSLLMADDIEPGSDVSYQLCKTIYTHHVLGKKLADTPITLAQSQKRDIAVPTGPDVVKEAFQREWEKIGADGHIFNIGSLSRVYGVAAIILVSKELAPDQPVDFTKLADLDISFNVVDPLNTAGSFTTSLNPNEPDFLKQSGVTVAGVRYHRSRSIVKMNEKPIYLSWTTAAFGWTGRSVYQRTLFPLKSFIRTMITDEMVSRKAGLLIAKMKQAGSIISSVMANMFALKRQMLQEGQTDNVLGITPDESIETLNMQNVNTAMAVSRKNILDNIATGADMPAIILNQETFAEGFGEGVEDARSVARYIGGVRDELDPIYGWFDQIVMARAWNPAFYKTVQAEYNEYEGVSYEEAFFSWRNAFKPTWPSLIEEPESEKAKNEDVKLKGIIATVQVVAPMLPDQLNRAALLGWAQDNINANEIMFPTPLNLDLESIASYVPPEPVAADVEEPAEPKPFSDSASRLRVA